MNTQVEFYTDHPDATGPRNYNRPREPNMNLVNPKGKDISSNSKNPIVIGIDCTGSMADWPAEIFDRLPLLCKTLAKYRPDVEISFSVIGDAYCDQYPLQVADFKSGPDLEKVLKALYPEGGGGGQAKETYELWGHYMLKHASTPKAEGKPFMIIFGDEGYYDKIAANQVRHYIGDNLQRNQNSMQMWQKLKEKFNIYMLRKDYNLRGIEEEIDNQWKETLGAEKIVSLSKKFEYPQDKMRAVDVAMGIIARQWGHFEDFEQSVGSRQEEEIVEQVVDTVGKIPSVEAFMTA